MLEISEKKIKRIWKINPKIGIFGDPVFHVYEKKVDNNWEYKGLFTSLVKAEEFIKLCESIPEYYEV